MVDGESVRAVVRDSISDGWLRVCHGKVLGIEWQR